MKARKRSFLGLSITFTAMASALLWESIKAAVYAIVYFLVVRVMKKVSPPEDKKVISHDEE